MGLQTLQPTSNTTPDQGGTTAVSGITNTSHALTVSSAFAEDNGADPPASASESKSARWSAFQSATGLVSGLVLKFTWTVSGTLTRVNDPGASATGSIAYVIEYSLNGGGSWITQVNQNRNTNGNLSAGTTETIVLAPSQNISQVQVRDRVTATAQATAPPGSTASSDATVGGTINTIQLVATTVDVNPPVCIM